MRKTTYGKSATLMLRGISVPYALVETIAHLLHDRELAGRLERAVANETRLLALEDDEVDSILVALADPPSGLGELRGRRLRDRLHRP